MLQKLRRLEERCDAANAQLDHDVALMRNQIAQEMMEAMNLTHRVEKSILEQRLEDAQQNIAIKNVRIELMDMKSEYGKLREAVDRPRLLPVGSQLAPGTGGALLKAIAGSGEMMMFVSLPGSSMKLYRATVGMCARQPAGMCAYECTGIYVFICACVCVYVCVYAYVCFCG